MQPKRIWNFLSMLGVKKEMPLHKQKSIILFNQILRLLVLILIIIAGLLYFKLELHSSAYFFLTGLVTIIISIFFNYKGKPEVSLYLVSFIIPTLILVLSLMAKKELGNTMLIDISPKIGLIISILISVSVGGFKSTKTAIIASLYGITIFFMFGSIHQLYGVKFVQSAEIEQSMFFIQYALSALLIFSVLLIIFQQNINFAYEKIVQKQHEEITAQRDQLFDQNELILKQQKKTTDSLLYAQRIQRAILPPEESLQKELKDFFVVYKPKNIVSGDFYWKRKLGTKVFLALADCTGHGVPGAFLSMLNLAFLNETVNQNQHLSAAQILENLRLLIKKSLRQETENAQKDGMDIAICIVDLNTGMLNFAGANSDLIYFANNKMQELKGDRQPIGIHRKEFPFTDYSISVSEKTAFYMCTDGFADQVGGATEEKFKKIRIKNKLQEIYMLPMPRQKEILETTLAEWMQMSKHYKNEQVDDISILAFRI